MRSADAEPERAGQGGSSLAVRARLDPEAWRPHRLTAGFAVGFSLTLGILGTLSAVWLVGMIATATFYALGTGGLVPVLAFAGTGALLARGWVGMVQTIRARLRHHDLDDLAALPPTFFALSRPLRRLVRHTRSLQIVVRDPELPLDELDREMFEWLATMAELDAEDRRRLEGCGLAIEPLRAELVESRWAHDRPRLAIAGPVVAGRATALVPASRHRERALAMLERFEHQLLRDPGDPFRGSAGRASPRVAAGPPKADEAASLACDAASRCDPQRTEPQPGEKMNG